MTETLGDVIRELRKAKKLTQEELAEGICSSVSLSRIENGIQMPSGQTLERLLQRLGTSLYQICNIYYENDQQQKFDEKMDEIMELFSVGNFSATHSFISEIEKESLPPFQKQYVLFLRAALGLYEGGELSDILDCLRESLSQTKPAFNYENFTNTLLTPIETNVLNVMSVVYNKMGCLKDAISLNSQLYQVLCRSNSKLKKHSILKANVLFNLVEYLEADKRFEEAWQHLLLLEEMSQKEGENILLLETLFIKAKLLYYLRKEEESLQILKALSPMAALLKKEVLLQLVQRFALEKFNLQL